jgi:hypothetical protein
MGAHRITGAGPAGYVHTAGNAVPALAERHEDLLDSLSGIHPGLDQIRAGFRLLMTERLSLDETQTLMSALAGDLDGNDVQGLLAAAIARLADLEANPCLRDLDHDTAMDVRRIGAAVAVDLDTTAPRDLVAELSARTDPYAEQDGGQQ